MSNEAIDTEVVSQALAVREPMAVAQPASLEEIVGQVSLIQQVMAKVMREGEHYGKIPGCGNKPALLKPGAEKLGLTFRLAPAFSIKRTDHPGGHREYEVVCTLNGKYQGVGTCSTLEAKYRYRQGPKKLTDTLVPKTYWDLRSSEPAKAQALIGGSGFSTAKNEAGQWVVAEVGARVDHDNPADHYNTVLKMAKKRAHVDAVLTATAASDIFAQDIEDFPPQDASETAEKEPAATAPVANPRPQTPKPPPRQAAPTKTPGNAQSAPNPPDPEKCKARLLQAVSAKHWEVFAWEWMVKEGWLLNTEALRDFPVHKAPLTKEAFEMLMGIFEQGLRKAVLAGGVTQKLQEEFDAAHADPFSDDPPLSVVDAIVDGVKDDVYDASNPEPSAEDDRWRQFPMPFGKHAGVALEDLEKNYLFGLWANYKVETEFKGKPKKPETIKRDEEFRAMLDLAGEHYQFKLPQ